MKSRTLINSALRAGSKQASMASLMRATSFSSAQDISKSPEFEDGGKMRDIVEEYTFNPDLKTKWDKFTEATRGAIKDPTRADYVSQVAELTGGHALTTMYEKMIADPVGRRILEEKPRLRAPFFDWRKYESYPETSFGGQYLKFMGGHGYLPEERPVVKYVDDPTLAYVFQRYKEVHDFCHVLLNYDTTVLEELGLKWFEMVQTELPGTSLSALIVPMLKLNSPQKSLFYSTYVPHATKNAYNGKYMMNIYYEEYMEMDVEEVRHELGYTAMPPMHIPSD